MEKELANLGYVLKVMVVLWAVVAAVAVGLMMIRPAAAQEVDAALVLVADVSASMDQKEQAFVRQAHAYALMSGEVLGAIEAARHGRIAVAYVEFADRAEAVVGWTLVDGPESAGEFAALVQADRVHDLGSSTNPAKGMEMAGLLLATLPWPSDKLVVDVVGDGDDGKIAAERQRDALVAFGAVLNGLPLLLKPDGSAEAVAGFYAMSIAGGPGHFVLPVTALDQLPQALRQKLVLELF